jgi:hypothetical protein
LCAFFGRFSARGVQKHHKNIIKVHVGNKIKNFD